MRGALVSASGASLLLLGRLPTARPAYADHVGSGGYHIKPLPCPGYAYYENNDTCKPCGPNYMHPDACETSGHYEGYHKTAGCTWSLRKNQCASGDPTPDGWIWQIDGTCGGCTNPKFRCHDGYNCTGPEPECRYCEKTICKWRTQC